MDESESPIPPSRARLRRAGQGFELGSSRPGAENDKAARMK